MADRNSTSSNPPEFEALYRLANLAVDDFYDVEEQGMVGLDGEDPEAEHQIGLSGKTATMVDPVQVVEQTQNKQDVDKKGKRPLEASTEEEKIKRRKEVQKMKLGGFLGIKYDNVRSNEYLNNLVTDSGTQRLFLEAILAYFQERGEHPLKKENRKDFLMDTLGVVGVQIEDFNRAIRLVWPNNVKDLQISEIKEALSDTRFAYFKK